MNIFAPYSDPVASAIALADKHVVKMALETAQILSTVLHQQSPSAALEAQAYRPTHAHHPCVKWAASSQAAAAWTLLHGLALCNEYAHRYGRTHKSYDVLMRIAPYLGLLPDAPLAPFAQAMPAEFHDGDAHAAYRAYLTSKYKAWGDARWTNRAAPDWCADAV